MTSKPTEVEDEPSSKRTRYSEGFSSGDFKDTSGHKTLLLAIVPPNDESYVNSRLLMDKLKQPAACSLCSSLFPPMSLLWDQETSLWGNSINSLWLHHNNWLQSGADPKDLKDYCNVVNQPLLTGDPDKPAFEHMYKPGLHILLGVPDKLSKELEKQLFTTPLEGFNKFSEFLAKINLKRVVYQGKHRLEGNVTKQLLNNVHLLECFLLNKCQLGLKAVPFVEGSKHVDRVQHFG